MLADWLGGCLATTAGMYKLVPISIHDTMLARSLDAFNGKVVPQELEAREDEERNLVRVLELATGAARSSSRSSSCLRSALAT